MWLPSLGGEGRTGFQPLGKGKCLKFAVQRRYREARLFPVQYNFRKERKKNISFIKS